MRTRRFEWGDPATVATAIRDWCAGAPEAAVDVAPILEEVRSGGDEALRRLTARFDATEAAPPGISVDPAEADAALAAIDSSVRGALELAAANIRAVAEATIDAEPTELVLPQGQRVELREIPVGAAGVYAPGGRAAYASSVLMCCVPARVAGVRRLAIASPPGPDGHLSGAVLAAAALCGVDEIYAVGGAQAIFALAYGTETIDPVDVIAGPGSAHVREAKRLVSGVVGIDSLAGPSELLVIAGHDTDPGWAALDLCAQAEHGPDSPLVLAAVEEAVIESIAATVTEMARERPSVADAPLALVAVPDLIGAAELANALAPEHVELLSEDAAELAGRLTTAGCVFVGRHSATAFGDYAAGSNHVLPTGGAGRFSGPLSPRAFSRQIANVSLPAGAAAALAPRVDVLARAEGLPVHGESAMIRSEKRGQA